MVRWLRPWILPALVSTTLGCTSLSNFVITPHPLSLREGAVTMEEVSCTSAEAAGGVAPAIAGILVEGVKRLAEAEAKQYQASYSAVRNFEWSRGNCIFVLHRVASGAQLTLLLVHGELQLSTNKTGARIRLTTIPGGVKSKVAGLALPTTIWETPGLSRAERWNAQIGYLWPWMWLHTIYGRLINHDVFGTDVNLRIRVDAVTDNGASRANKKLAEVDAPYGQFDVTGPGGPEAERTFESGWFAAPVNKQGWPIPATLTITVMEANDLGDTIGRGAELIGEKKGDLVGRLLGTLGP